MTGQRGEDHQANKQAMHSLIPGSLLRTARDDNVTEQYSILSSFVLSVVLALVLKFIFRMVVCATGRGYSTYCYFL